MIDAVFLSYNRRDQPIVEDVAQRLRAAGLAPWLDRWQLTPGERWQDAIAAALDTVGACAVFLGPDGLGDWVREEAALALDRAAKDHAFRVFLVLLPGLPEPFDVRLVPPFLRTRTWVDLRAGPDDPDAWASLINAMSGARPAQSPPSPPRPPTTAPARGPVHLPIPPDPLIGREREVARITERVRQPDVRMVTLTGPGGTGKTRLALAAATALADAFADGVVFVALAALTDPFLVLPTIAEAAGIRDLPGITLRESVYAALRGKQMLLVLDNFEQVIAAAPEIGDLLAACAGLTLLVTSRAALHLRGEHEFAVPPLEMPGVGPLPAEDALQRYEAIRLFVDRARAIKPDFALTEENAPAVVAICQRLDGLPLAIELAAARVRLLAPAALLTRLNKSLAVLTGGARDLPARQQTLRDTIRWSYDLLRPDEQTLLRRFAVFVNGGTLAAIEAVCGGDGSVNSPGSMGLDVLDGMESLLAQSLVRQAEGTDGEPRFGMLQTIREFCLEEINTHGEAEPVRAAHAAYFLAVAEEGDAALRGQHQGIWFERLEEEHDNLRAALEWSLTDRPSMLPLRIANAMGLFWLRHGHHVEGIRWLEACLGASPDVHDTLHADALNHIGEMLIAQTEFDRAHSNLADGLAIARSLDYKIGIARLSMNLGFLAQHRSAYATARRYYDEALAMYRETGDRDGLGATLNVLGIIAFREGNYIEARDLYEQSLRQLRAQGNEWRIANIINNIALIAHLLGDYAGARRLHTENLATRRRLGDTMGVASTLTNFGQVCCDDGDPAARALLEEGLATYRELGDKVRAGRAQLFLALTLHYRGETVAPYALLQESLAVLRAVGEKPDVVDALEALGRVAAARGDLAAARAYFREALASARELHDRPRLSQLLECFAVVAVRDEQLAFAARLWGAAEAVRRSAGVALAGIHRRQHERDVALAAARCDAALWAASWEGGGKVALDDLIAEMLSGAQPDQP